MADKLDEMRMMLGNAGMSDEQIEPALESIAAFTGAMSVVLDANKLLAPNYLTFALGGDGDARFELTIRRHPGKTPCERISELKALLKVIHFSSADGWQPFDVEKIHDLSREGLG